MNQLEVVVDSRRRDCFAVLHAQLYAQRCQLNLHFSTSTAPSRRTEPLELQRIPNSGSNHYNNSSSSTDPPMVVACLAHDAVHWLSPGPVTTTHLKLNQIALSPLFALDMGLQQGDVVRYTPWRSVAEAAVVVVSPFTVDDSEIVECNALRIEAELLRVLQLVMVGMRVTVTLQHGLSVKLVVQDVRYRNPKLAGGESGSQQRLVAAVLTPGTELHVAVRNRPLPAVSSSSTTTPRSGIVRVATLWSLTSCSSTELHLTSTQAAWHGVADGTVVGLVNLVEMANSANALPAAAATEGAAGKAFLAPSFLRQFAARATVRIRSANEENCVEEEVATVRLPRTATAVVDGGGAQQAGGGGAYYVPPANFLLLVNPPEVVQGSLAALLSRHATRSLTSSPLPAFTTVTKHVVENTSTAPSSSADSVASSFPNLLNCAATQTNCSRGSAMFEALRQWKSPLHHQKSGLSLLTATHGDVVSTLHGLLLSFSSSSSKSSSSSSSLGAIGVGRHNILLTGAKGTGKTTIACVAAATVPNLYVHYLSCEGKTAARGGGGGGDRSFLEELAEAVRCCRLHSPSVLILDSFHLVAPAQQEGHVPSLSTGSMEAIRTLLSLARTSSGDAINPAALVPSASLFPATATPPSSIASRTEAEALASGMMLLCVAEGSRDDIHEGLRGAAYFGSILRVEPLTTASRTVIIEQELQTLLHCEHLTDTESSSNSSRTKGDGLSVLLKRLVKLTEGYAPFDILVAMKRLQKELVHLALRGKNEGTDPSSRHWKDAAVASLVESAESLLAGIVPLSREGTNFLANKSSSTTAATAPPSWDDIGGLAEAKKVLHDSLVLPLKYPKLFASLPLKTRSGVLLFGPSGCGKSYVMQTVAAAEKLQCIVINGPEIFGKYIGQSEQRIREAFERAQAAAPSIVFFEEFEALAPQRGNDNSGVTDRVVNQLLCYLDGVEGRSGVTVVAASSRPDLIDAALLRPGRLDKAVYCSLPTAEERKEILKAHARKVPLMQLFGDADWDAVVAATVDWTSADLASLISTAVMKLLQRTLDLSRELSALNIEGAVVESTSRADAASNDNNKEGAPEHGAVIMAPSAVQRKQLEEQLIAHYQQQQQVLYQQSSQTATSGQVRGQNDTKLTVEDVLAVVATTRRSLTGDGVKKQSLLFQRFLASREPQGAPMQAPGTKLATA